MSKKRPEATAAAPLPDLSHIVEGLRPLAVPIGEVHFDPANARIHDSKNLKAIEGSLHVYGQRKPIIVNRREKNVTEAGNGTLQAARNLGWKHVAVLYVDDDPVTAAGYKLADNRTSDLSGWNREILDKLLREMNVKVDPRLDSMLADLRAETKIVRQETDSAPDDLAQSPKESEDSKSAGITSIVAKLEQILECLAEDSDFARDCKKAVEILSKWIKPK